MSVYTSVHYKVMILASTMFLCLFTYFLYKYADIETLPQWRMQRFYKLFPLSKSKGV